MFNLLKSDLYRLWHGKTLKSLGIALVLIAMLDVAVLWWATTPEVASALQGSMTADVHQVSEEAAPAYTMVTFSLSYVIAQNFVTGGVLSFAVSLVVALFFVQDFDSGYVKNLIGGQRRAYYGGRLVLCAVLSAVIVALAVASCALFLTIAGFEYTNPDTAGRFLCFMGLTWLVAFAYAVATAAVVWATRSKACGAVFAVVVSSGAAGSIVAALAVSFAGTVLPAFVGDAVQWLPAMSSRFFRTGAEGLFVAEAAPGGVVPWLHVLVVSGVLALVCGAIGFAANVRRDVK